jgi:RNA polymerase sigma-70 factor (ECF subfamily)
MTGRAGHAAAVPSGAAAVRSEGPRLSGVPGRSRPARSVAGTGDADGHAAFEALFQRAYADVARFCARRLLSPHDAEEAATEVFAVAWRRRGELPPEPEDRLWLLGVARKVVGNHLRSERRRERLLCRLRHEASTGAPAAADPVPGGGARDVVEALAALREGDRELLLLAAWEGLEVREIAVVLGKPAPVVSRRLHRARGRLESEMRKRLGDPAPAGHQ